MPQPDPSTGKIEPIEFDIVQKSNGKVIGGERYMINLPSETQLSQRSRDIGIDALAISSEAFVYPNPAKDFINIEFGSTNDEYDIELYNLLGERIYQKTALTVSYTINTSAIESGVYLLSVTNLLTNKSSSHKIIIE